MGIGSAGDDDALDPSLAVGAHGVLAAEIGVVGKDAVVGRGGGEYDEGVSCGVLPFAEEKAGPPRSERGKGHEEN